MKTSIILDVDCRQTVWMLDLLNPLTLTIQRPVSDQIQHFTAWTMTYNLSMQNVLQFSSCGAGSAGILVRAKLFDLYILKPKFDVKALKQSKID